MKQLVRKAFNMLGYDISKKIEPCFNTETPFPVDFNTEEINIIKSVLPYTMTSPERIYSLIQAVKFIVRNKIPGDIVECGVWMGGSMLTIAKTLIELGEDDRNLYLYDTFDGMTVPTENDIAFNNQSASDMYVKEKGSQWCSAPLEKVKEVMYSSGYSHEKIHFIRGKVEETLPDFMPNHISLLRLDTDWYESTYHELLYLFPVLSHHGMLIIDDYGYWQGAKLAVDQYFQENDINIFLSRIDDTGRIAIKL